MAVGTSYTTIITRGKQVFGTFTITAHKYSDGSYDGEYVFDDHVVDWKSFNKFHGKVLFLKVYGNQVLVGGREMTGEAFKDWYDAFLLTDNGQGNNAPMTDIRSRCIVTCLRTMRSLGIMSGL